MQNVSNHPQGTNTLAPGARGIASTSSARVLLYASIVLAVAGAGYLAEGIRLAWQTQKVDCAIGVGFVLLVLSAGCGALHQRRREVH